MQDFYPTMTGLRAFEAAARHRSFTRAAIELNLTQSAVSHQIRKLEELLGAQLFDRIGNEIRLSAAGASYYNVARSAITDIRLATDRAMRQGNDDVLTIGALGTFAVKCLIPRLNGFKSQNPGIHLRLRIVPASLELPVNDCDVSILYGREADWPGFVVTRLTTEELFPVCSPSLLAGPIGLEKPQDLARHTIIRTSSPLILRDDWPFWMRHAEVSDIKCTQEITCDLLYPSYQLAIEGLGIAMGRSAVVQGDIEAGRLAEPFSVRLQSTFGYFLVHLPQRVMAEKIDRFVSWTTTAFPLTFFDETDPLECHEPP